MTELSSRAAQVLADLRSELDDHWAKFIMESTQDSIWKKQQGLRSHLSIWDEVVFSPPNPSYTPAEFTKLWDRMSHLQRIVYVMQLLDKGNA